MLKLGHVRPLMPRPLAKLPFPATLPLMISLCWSLCSLQAHAAPSLFKINPYLLKNSKNETVLKFALKKSRKITLTSALISPVKEKVQQKSITGSYKAYENYEINLGPQLCDHQLSYEVKSEEREEGTLVQEQVEAIPCNADEDLVFGFLADTQQNMGHEEVAKIIEDHLQDGTQFIVSAGDMVHFGAQPGQWTTHFRIAQPYYRRLPVVAAIGNHEYWYSYIRRGSSYYFRQNMRSEGDARNYALHLSFPQIELIVMNSNFGYFSDKEYEAQNKWMMDILQAAKAQNKKAILVMHHAPFTSGASKAAGQGRVVRDELIPLWEKAGNVPLALFGHEHIYERFLKNKIHYLVAGPAGGGKYRAVTKNPYSQFVNDRARTYSVIRVNRTRIEIKTYDLDGSLIDQVAIPL